MSLGQQRQPRKWADREPYQYAQPPPGHERWCAEQQRLYNAVDDAAREEAGLPLKPRTRPYARRRQTQKGCCAGCGRPHAERTPGCSNCLSRHLMRRLAQARKRERQLASSLVGGHRRVGA